MTTEREELLAWVDQNFDIERPAQVVAQLQEIIWQTHVRATAAGRAQVEARYWAPVTRTGQVKVGDRLRFNIGDKAHTARAKLILQPGAKQEEVIYHKGNNFYFITAMVVDGASSHKSVEVLTAGQPEAKEAPARDENLPTDLSHRLRETADQQPGWKPLLTAAADEIERYYGGMMAWKQTAEKKDADWNAERMARVDERCAARATKEAPAALSDEQIENIERIAHRWAQAAYCKALNKGGEDIDSIRKELRIVLAAAGNSQDAKDAARFRYICDNAYRQTFDLSESQDSINATIDAAMAAPSPAEG